MGGATAAALPEIMRCSVTFCVPDVCTRPIKTATPTHRQRQVLASSPVHSGASVQPRRFHREIQLTRGFRVRLSSSCQVRDCNSTVHFASCLPIDLNSRRRFGVVLGYAI